METEPYYIDQKDWQTDDYYALHRYLNRMVLKRESKIPKFSSMDMSKMSDETKVMLYCLIVYYNAEELFELENFRQWLITPPKPLEKTLIIGKYHTNINNIYDEMNVFC